MNKHNKLDQLIQDITKLGCVSVQDATLCAFTYLELQRKKDVDLVDAISYHYNKHFKKLYCQAQTLESGKVYIYVPISSASTLEYQTWEDYFSLIPTDISSNVLILAIWEPDGTHVFYEITKGLGSPPREKERNEKHGNHEQNKLKHFSDSEIPSTSRSKRKFDETSD